MLNVIELAHVGQEYVYQNVTVVHGYPLRVAKAVDEVGLLLAVDSHCILNGIGDCAYLVGRVSLANHKVVTYAVAELEHIYYNNLFTLFVLYTFYYLLDDILCVNF